MIDATLDERLRVGVCEMLDAYPAMADWEGVVREVDQGARARRWASWRGRRIGRTLVLAAALVLVGGSIAFALGDRLVGAFTGGPPPLSVEQQMRQFSEFSGGAAGTVVPGSMRLTIRLATRRFGVVRLYSGRATRGVCELIVRDGKRSGQCSPDRVATGSPVVFGFGGTPEKPGSNLVDGHTVSPAARSLRIRFRRGPSRSIAVHDRFFLFELGPSHSQRSSNPPVAFDVLDAVGHTIGTRRDPLRVEGRSLLGTSPVPASIRTIARAWLPLGRGRVTIQRGRDVRDRPCFGVLLHETVSAPPTWVCNSSVGRYGHEIDLRHPTSVRRVTVSWTRSATYASGWVAPRVVRLEVRFQDGSAATVPLHHGYFVYVIRPRMWRPGHLPSELRAFDASGTLAYRQALPPVQVCASSGGACGSTSQGLVAGTGVGSTGFSSSVAPSP